MKTRDFVKLAKDNQVTSTKLGYLETEILWQKVSNFQSGIQPIPSSTGDTVANSEQSSPWGHSPAT